MTMMMMMMMMMLMMMMMMMAIVEECVWIRILAIDNVLPQSAMLPIRRYGSLLREMFLVATFRVRIGVMPNGDSSGQQQTLKYSSD